LIRRAQMDKPKFTAHNIRLDDGQLTFPESDHLIEGHPWCVSAKRILETIFPADRSQVRVADLGCLEGGFAVEFARMGFKVLGLEVRESNMAACRFVKDHVNLPNLEFVRDDAWNIADHGVFDAVFCCGLLYHLDQPRRFLELLAAVTSRLLILQTHFVFPPGPEGSPPEPSIATFNLSAPAENESLPGRWYTEFPTDADFQAREQSRWASWDNRRSFWIQREHLIGAIARAGFDLVAEQFDGVGEDIPASMLDGHYRNDARGTFIGVKTKVGSRPISRDVNWY
jgi:hypothetical protein